MQTAFMYSDSIDAVFAASLGAYMSNTDWKRALHLKDSSMQNKSEFQVHIVLYWACTYCMIICSYHEHSDFDFPTQSQGNTYEKHLGLNIIY